MALFIHKNRRTGGGQLDSRFHHKDTKSTKKKTEIDANESPWYKERSYVNSKPHRVSASIAFDMKFASFVLTSALLAFLSHASRGHQSETSPTGPKVMVVGVYHFVSKANLYSMSVDDPLSPDRQAQIKDVVTHLAKFEPTKVVLEETAGTSDLEPNYQKYLQDKFELPASENYQIGFRLARSAGLKKINLINAWTDFDYDQVKQYADSHGQSDLLEKAADQTTSLLAQAENIQKAGTVLDVLRYFNAEEAIRANNSFYLYMARIGDSDNYVGAKLVASWHLRNLEMFANLTRLIEGPAERIVVLYGQGHEFLLKQFIRESPDLELVDALDFL